MMWMRFFIVLYSVLVFFILVRFHQNRDEMVSFFLLFLFFIVIYVMLCCFTKIQLTKNMLLIMYTIFYCVFLFPVLFQALSHVGSLWRIWKILLWISPFFMFIFRTYLVDLVSSWRFIRKIFLKKDSEIWNCPRCHVHITKRPVVYCPHCGYNRYITEWYYGVYCRGCGFVPRVKEFQIPNYCPHCGLSFKRIMSRQDKLKSGMKS